MAQLLHKTSQHSGKNVVAFEFFSGIGGFHAALQFACGGKVLKAFEISLKCTATYSKNFPDTKIIKKTIDSLKVDDLVFKEALQSNSLFVWLLSPPCQPFTRQGKKGDSDDHRTDSFFHLMHIMSMMTSPPQYLMVENVRGFEVSLTRQHLVELLNKMNYTFQEFLLSPKQFIGINYQ